jgi:hypothetical protein
LRSTAPNDRTKRALIWNAFVMSCANLYESKDNIPVCGA